MGILNLLHTAQCCDKLIFSSDKMVKDFLSQETPRDRIIRMYSTSEYGYSPEIHYVITTGTATLVMSAFYGGIKGMVNEQKEYIRKNLASTYESQHLARRHFTDRMTIATFKGAFNYGVKYGGFCSLYLLSTFTVANYRNKVSPWEHAASVAVIGGIARINYGLKGMLAAGTLGGILGFVAGSIFTLAMKYGGLTMHDLRCWQHEEYNLMIKKSINYKLSKSKENV